MQHTRIANKMISKSNHWASRMNLRISPLLATEGASKCGELVAAAKRRNRYWTLGGGSHPVFFSAPSRPNWL